MDKTKLKRMKPQTTSTLDFLKAFQSIYMLSTLKLIAFKTRSTPKRTQKHLMRKQCGIKAHKPMIQLIHTQKSLESEFPIPSPLCIRVFSQKQL